MQTKLAIFKGSQIRKTVHQNEWWFVIEDVVSALTGSNDPKQYLQKIKQREPELNKGWVQIVHTLIIDTCLPAGRKNLHGSGRSFTSFRMTNKYSSSFQTLH